MTDLVTVEELIERGAVCCQPAAKGGTILTFNPFNAVVQCHACGQVYRPTSDSMWQHFGNMIDMWETNVPNDVKGDLADLCEGFYKAMQSAGSSFPTTK